MQAPADTLWTIGDVAAYLQCSASKVAQFVQYDAIPSFMIGGSRRFRPADIKAWADGAAEGQTIPTPKALEVRARRKARREYLARQKAAQG